MYGMADAEYRRVGAVNNSFLKLMDPMPGSAIGFFSGGDKPQFRIGRDRLSFTVKSAREGHVYVLLHSTEGEFMQLFPNKMARNNRIKAGQTLSLPQSTWPMDVAGPAGTDHFLVIVSSQPRNFDN